MAASSIKRRIMGQSAKNQLMNYYKRFITYAFVDSQCKNEKQFEASITRLYHTIEKGLSYKDFRAGFGKDNIEKLLISLEQYASKGFDTSSFFYETAISCLHEYIRKNKEYGYDSKDIEDKILRIPGKSNDCGGVLSVSKPLHNEDLNYEKLLTSRHSIRHFSDKPVDVELLVKAIKLAQFTPSACNRQGWRTLIVTEKEKIKFILANQNGNRGFGQEFDKLLVVTADLRTQQRGRELFQAFIDGGMYAQSVLNALYFKGVGSVPLSASLTPKQDDNVRSVLKISDAEVFIVFIGVGSYPEEEFQVARSERKPAQIEIV